MLLLFILLYFNQQMLLLFILLVIDGNQLLFHCTLFHFDQQMLLLFVLLVLLEYLNRNIGKYQLPHIWDEVLVRSPEMHLN